MEKLHFLKHSFFFFLFSSVLFTNAQNNFYVYKTEGKPTIIVNDTLQKIYKGTKISEKSIVTLKNGDKLMLINKKGNLFKIPNAGKYKFSDIEKIKSVENNSSLTSDYFAYVWKQFTNNKAKKLKTGVVYRTDNITLMLQPADSIKIYFPEVKFTWSTHPKEKKTLYFILKEKNDSHITKIGTESDNLTLFVDNELLSRGKTYEWTVSETKYPNFEDVKFYNFELLDTQKFRETQEKMAKITSELKKLGFENDEIKRMLCEDYKVCY